jgi:hypothetical protein
MNSFDIVYGCVPMKPTLNLVVWYLAFVGNLKGQQLRIFLRSASRGRDTRVSC